MSRVSQVSTAVLSSPVTKAGRFAMHLVECEPFPGDPRIAGTRVFTQSALFELAIDHIVGMWVLVKARQWRTKTMRIVRYFMSDGCNQHAFWHVAVLE